MRRRWLAALLVLLPAPALAQDMCAALRQIEAAARAPEPFSSLRGKEQGLIPGYRNCRIGTGAQAVVLCHTTMASESLVVDRVGAVLRDCLGATAMPRRGWGHAYEFRTRDLVFSVSSHCNERCHVGRIASITVARRREDNPAPPR